MRERERESNRLTRQSTKYDGDGRQQLSYVTSQIAMVLSIKSTRKYNITILLLSNRRKITYG